MTAHNPDELLRQFHDNQSLWVARLSTGQTQPQFPHDRLLRVGETVAMRPGAAGVVMLPMHDDVDAVLREHHGAFVWLRQSRAKDVLVWNMQPNPHIDLALLAQGYSPGFEPWWMTRDLADPIPEPRHLVRPVTDLDIRKLYDGDFPYVVRDQIAANRALIDDPDGPQVMWLVAIEDGEPVGHGLINFMGEHAGLFNVGVSGTHRHRGIGTSITLAAMKLARDRGIRTMNLNSTPAGKKLYENTGFTQFGVGQTWVRSGRQVYTEPDRDEQALIYAIGSGDIRRIKINPYRHQHLQCGLSPQELAARFGQPESLLEIIRQGLIPDIISLWKAGLRDEAIAATHVSDSREMISGATRAHPIHHAVEMGAGTLVIELINAGANLKARDAEYNATPLDWAHATNKPTIARIIRQAGGQ